MVKAIIFDYGKVIGYAAGTGIRSAIGKAYEISEEQVRNAMSEYVPDFRKGLITEDEFWERFSKFLNKPTPANKYDLWRNGFTKQLKIKEEMLEYVRNLKQRGYVVAVLSNNIQPFVDIIRDRNGYDDFDVVINSCEVGLSKPDPEIYRLALNKLGLKAEETVFIDDKEENLAVARNLGMQTVLAESPEQIKRDIEIVLKV